MLSLPEPLDEQFVEALNLIDEEESHMAFMTSVERVLLRREREQGKREGRIEGQLEGKRQGEREGQQKGAAQILTTQIISKFGHIPDWAKARIKQTDETTLTQWAVKVLDAQCVEDIFN